MTVASATSILYGVIANANIMSTAYSAVIIGTSNFFISRLIVSGMISDDTPSMNSVLNMFEPTTLDILMSFMPFTAPLILTDASGALVPMDTSVSPMTSGGTLSARASLLAPPTKKSAPFIKSNVPTMRRMMLTAIAPPLSTDRNGSAFLFACPQTKRLPPSVSAKVSKIKRYRVMNYRTDG